MNVRRYRDSDLPQVLQLFYDTVHTVNARDYAVDQLEAWAPLEPDEKRWAGFMRENISYVVERDQQILGFGDLTEKGYLHTLYVHKDYQGKGVASTLLETFEKEAAKLDVTTITTEASITAKDFFELKGFKCVEKREKYLNGQVFVNYTMMKTLIPKSVK
nr:GNAT family N-acetyltransferase [Heliobacterium chlorum]